MLNLALKPNQFVGGDVGQIRDDAIESICRSGKQARLMEVDLNRVVDCVLAGKAQCFEGNIGCPHCGEGIGANVIAMTPEPVPTSRMRPPLGRLQDVE